jgi:hypothetical protein
MGKQKWTALIGRLFLLPLRGNVCFGADKNNFALQNYL